MKREKNNFFLFNFQLFRRKMNRKKSPRINLKIIQVSFYFKIVYQHAC